MKLFTLKHAGKKHRMGQVTLQPGKPQTPDKPELCAIACGAFTQDEASKKHKPTGLALRGEVPVKELVRWAKRKGYLKWNRSAVSKSVNKVTLKKQESSHERNANAGLAKAVPGAASSGR
jgi:hypothetical protein